MLAWFIHDFSPFLVRFGDRFGIRWYGLAYVAGFLVGYWLYKRLAIRRLSPLPPAAVADFITGTAIFGVLAGGRLGWVLFYGLAQDHSQDAWWWPLEVWNGGMSAHGGMLGVVLFTLWYARRHRLSWTGIGDSLCVVAPVGIFFGRLANFINGELYGKPSTVPWAVIFPDDPRPRHPSQLYEALLEGVLLFAAMWLLRTRSRLPRGMLTGWFFVLYAVARCVSEIFREPDPAWAVGFLSAGQTLSIGLAVLGIGFLVWGTRNRQYEAGLQTAPPAHPSR